MHSPVNFPFPLLNLFLFLKFEVTQVWPIFLFMLSVCIFLLSGGRCLKGRRRVVPQASHWLLASWGAHEEADRGLKALGALNYCQRGGGIHIDLTVTFIAPRQRQSSRACSRQVPIQDWEQGSLLSAFAGVPVVGFHVWVVTFLLSLFSSIWSSLRATGGGSVGGETSLGQGMAYVWKAFHVCLLECMSRANCLAESLLKMSCIWDVQIFLLLLLAFTFYKKDKLCEAYLSSHLSRFCCCVTLVSMHSVGIHCL